MVEITEIWKRKKVGKNLYVVIKPLAILANGRPLYLDKDLVMERTQRPEEDINKLKVSYEDIKSLRRNWRQ